MAETTNPLFGKLKIGEQGILPLRGGGGGGPRLTQGMDYYRDLKGEGMDPRMTMGRFGRNAPRDKAVKLGGKVYTNDRAHINALEDAAIKMGFRSLEEALAKRPDLFDIQDPQQFGEIGPKGEFVPMPNNEGSKTFDDYMGGGDSY